MANLNRCDFIGNLGGDVELRYTQTGTAVAKCSIACNESWKDKDSGEKKERTEWVNLEFWGRLAEIASEYLQKGAPVYVSGQLRTDKYERDGVTKYFTKISVREMQMLSGGGARGGPKEQPRDYADAKGKEPKYDPPPAPSSQKEFDDDIPF